MNETTLTVADLIRALQKLPPEMEIWIQNVSAFYPDTDREITSDEVFGLCVADDKLIMVYDHTVRNAQLLDFSEDDPNA